MALDVRWRRALICGRENCRKLHLFTHRNDITQRIVNCLIQLYARWKETGAAFVIDVTDSPNSTYFLPWASLCRLQRVQQWLRFLWTTCITNGCYLTELSHFPSLCHWIYAYKQLLGWSMHFWLESDIFWACLPPNLMTDKNWMQKLISIVISVDATKNDTTTTYKL